MTDEKCTICRLCLHVVSDNSMNPLEEIANIVQSILPRLDPPLMQNDILCEMCLDNIQIHYNFVEMCSNVEERINIYRKAYGNGTIGEVDLLHILEFSLNTDNYVGKLEIKEEKLEENDLPAGDILMSMNEDWLTKEEIPFKDEPEVYDSRVDLEARKVESQPEQAVDEITLKRIESSYLSNNKQVFVRKLDFHKGTSNLHRFKCHICAYQCSLKYRLTSHMLVHRDPAELDMFKCSQCKYQAKRKRNLKRHIVSHHRDSFIHTKEKEENTWECTKCTYLTTDKYLFEKHLMVHRDSNELLMFKCHLCNYQSKFKSHLKRHMLVHKNPTELDMYNCSQCEYQAK